MLPYITDTISVKRLVKTWNSSSLQTILTWIDSNIQPLTSDDLLYDIEVKKYNCFLVTNIEDLIQTNDQVEDQKWTSFVVSSVDWFKGPVLNTMELILTLNK